MSKDGSQPQPQMSPKKALALKKKDMMKSQRKKLEEKLEMLSLQKKNLKISLRMQPTQIDILEQALIEDKMKDLLNRSYNIETQMMTRQSSQAYDLN